MASTAVRSKAPNRLRSIHLALPMVQVLVPDVVLGVVLRQVPLPVRVVAPRQVPLLVRVVAPRQVPLLVQVVAPRQVPLLVQVVALLLAVDLLLPHLHQNSMVGLLTA